MVADYVKVLRVAIVNRSHSDSKLGNGTFSLSNGRTYPEE
jgi:hypothetical protein